MLRVRACCTDDDAKSHMIIIDIFSCAITSIAIYDLKFIYIHHRGLYMLRAIYNYKYARSKCSPLGVYSNVLYSLESFAYMRAKLICGTFARSPARACKTCYIYFRNYTLCINKSSRARAFFLSLAEHLCKIMHAPY